MNKEQLYETIEQYLDGTLSGEALKQFEHRLQTEPDFAEEVTLHRKLQQELGDTQKRQLRSTLDVLRKEFTVAEEETKIVPINRNRRLRIVMSIAAGILILILAILVFFNRTPKNPKIVDDKPPIDKQDDFNPNETPPKEIEDPSNLVDDNPDLKKDEKDEGLDFAPAPQESQLASFEPNPELENLIAQNGNNEFFDFSIEKPTEGESFTLKGDKIDLQINGMIFTNDLKDENSIEIVLYDNYPQNFKSKKSVGTFRLLLEKDTSEEEGIAFATKFEDGYFFNLQKTIDISAGLYYFLILQKGQKNPLYTGKFEVKK